MYLLHLWPGRDLEYIPALYTTCIVTNGHLTIILLWLYIGTVAHKKNKTGDRVFTVWQKEKVPVVATTEINSMI